MRYQAALRISTVCYGILFLFGIFPLSSCGSGMGDFQENQTYDYKLFDLLDKYPALHDTVHLKDPNNTQYRSDQCDKQQIRLDQCVVNTLLNDVINEHYQENTNAMAGQYVTIDSTKAGIPNQYPMQNIVQLMRHLVFRIINQDSLDNGVFNPETKQRSASTLDYAANFFSFLDDINDKNLNLGKELVTIMRAMTKFRIDNFDSALMRKEVEFANTDMDATPCQAATYNKEKCDHVLAHHKLLVYQQTSVGKSNLQADYPMWLDSGGHLIAHWQNINSGDSKTNVGIGNAVQGNQSLMMAFFELVKDGSFRNNLYDLVRQLGVFLSGSIPNQNTKIADVAEALVRNIESYFTTGGTVAKTDSRYSTDDPAADVYSSGELRNTLRELQPGNTRLALRSDRQNASSNNAPLSLIYEVKGKKRYPLDELLKGLKSIGWNPDDAHIEQSLDDLIRYDQYGRPRTTNSCGTPNDTSHCPHQASLLESLLFVNAAAANYGWTDACLDKVDGEPDSPGGHTSCDPLALSGKNYGHGHGNVLVGSALNPSPNKSAGATLNDVLYGMGTNLISGIAPLYQMTFYPSDQNHLFRNIYPFTINGYVSLNLPSMNDNKFYFNQNYPVAYFLAIGSGAVASPNGGKSLKDTGGNPVLNSYMPFQGNGLENDNLALSTIVGAWHVVWNGAGPYYYDPEKAGMSTEMVPCNDKEQKLCHKYYRANGKLYALVYKPTGARANNWEYIFPANDATDPLWPIAFYIGKIGVPPNRSVFTSSVYSNERHVDPLNGGHTGIELPVGTSYSFTISMGGNNYPVTISNSDPKYNKYITNDDLCTAINTATGGSPCSATENDSIKIENPYEGTIVFTDNINTPGAINKLLVDSKLEGEISSYTVDLNAVKLTSDLNPTLQDAVVNITIDNNTFQAKFPKDVIWDRDKIVSSLVNSIVSAYTPQPAPQGIVSLARFSVMPYGKDRFRITDSPFTNSTPKIVRVDYVSGPNAVEILFNGNGNSIIRYQERQEGWRSTNLYDNYMGFYHDPGVPALVPAVDRYSTIVRDNNDNVKIVNLDPTKNKVESSGIVIQENIDDADQSRACASQEEAFFRNYQWFFVDKKYVLVMPQRLTFVNISELGIAYIYQEANGFYAFSNARTFRGNHLWAKTGKSGASNVPGDYRVGIVADLAATSIKLGQSGDSTYNDTLLGGAGFSSILAHNVTSLSRLAFPFSQPVLRGDKLAGNEDSLVSSNGFVVGDALWKRRNAFMPILMALVNALRENTDNTHSNTAGLVPTFDMFTLLLKPITYYQRGTGDAPYNTWKFRVLGDKNNPSDAYFLKSGADFYSDSSLYPTNKPKVWFGSWNERDYFQMAPTNTLISVLIDSNRYPTNTSDKKILDGILPLLVAKINPNTPDPTDDRPKVLTQVFKILMNLGDSAFDDPSYTDYNLSSQDFDKNFQSWGARRKLLYGLEQTQTMTSSKNTRGTLTTINDPRLFNNQGLPETLPDWMFTNGNNPKDGIPADMRPEEVYSNIDENILVGTNDYNEYLHDPNGIKPGELGYQMGLAYLPTDWKNNPDKLTLFRKYLEMSSELLRPQGDYSVVENVINVLDKFFNQVNPTNDQVKGLVHTLGIMATTYNKTTAAWNVPVGSWTADGKISFGDPKSHWEDPNWVDDLYRVAAQYQPIINTITLALDTGVELSFDERNGNQTNFNTSNFIFDSAVYSNALLKAGGLMEYVLDVVDTKDKFSEIFSELYAFLGEQLFTKFNSALWNDIAKLMAGQVQVLTRNDSPTAIPDRFQNFGFQYNGPN